MESKIQRIRLNNFRASGSILTGLFSIDAPRSRGDKMGTIFTMPAPKNLWRQKKSSKIFRHFWQLSTLIANISGTDQHIKNRKGSWSSTTTPTLGEKNLAYFGPQTKKLLTLIYVHPNGLFPGDYISALKGCCAMKFFTRARHGPRLLSAHPNWDKNF